MGMIVVLRCSGGNGLGLWRSCRGRNRAKGVITKDGCFVLFCGPGNVSKPDMGERISHVVAWSWFRCNVVGQVMG